MGRLEVGFALNNARSTSRSHDPRCRRILGLGARYLGCAVLLGHLACSPDASMVQSRAAPLRPGAISAETALLSLQLMPDGRARFLDARRRPFSFRLRPAERRANFGSGFFVEVSHGSAPAVQVPVELGSPTDPKGEAQSPWAAGGTILRAPCFGPRTHFALRQSDGKDVRTLAQIEVIE